MDYEVIIVGAGPAGIFSALTLAEHGIERVLLLEQGKELDQRQRRNSKDMLCGWGGAGAYSDGKLTLSSEVGGSLGEFLDQDSFNQLLTAADEVYVAHGAPGHVFGEASAELEELADRARIADLALIPAGIRHIGTKTAAASLVTCKSLWRVELKRVQVARFKSS